MFKLEEICIYIDVEGYLELKKKGNANDRVLLAGENETDKSEVCLNRRKETVPSREYTLIDNLYREEGMRTIHIDEFSRKV